MTDSLFLKILNNKYKTLKDFIIQNKYRLFIPSSSLILEGHLLEHFYNNHIYYQSLYDESIYINLNGKTLRNKGNEFESAFGWKNHFSFNIKETLTTSSGISCVLINGVCSDERKEIKQAVPNTISRDEQYKQYSTMMEYITVYKPLFDNEISESQFTTYTTIKKIVFKYRNTVILMKGHEHYYGGLLVGDIIPLFELMGNELRKLKMDENTINNVKYELVDSLLFEKLYEFIIYNLKLFYEKEENEFNKKLNSEKNKFDFEKDYEPYKECKFEEPMKKLKELSSKKSLFEKVNLITKINNEIGIEAKEVYEKATKKKYNAQGDLLIALWSHLIAKSKVEYLLAEIKFLENFNFYAMRSYGEESYLLTTFLSAFGAVYNEYMKEFNVDISQHIECRLIETGSFGFDKKK